MRPVVMGQRSDKGACVGDPGWRPTSLALAALALAVLGSGCYLSHQLDDEDAGLEDAGLPDLTRDALSPSDAEPGECVPVRVRSVLLSDGFRPWPNVLSGWMYLEGADGWESEVLRADDDGYMTGCVPVGSLPYDVLTYSALFNFGLLGFDGPLDTQSFSDTSIVLDDPDVIGRHDHPIRALHSEPGSVLLARVTRFHEFAVPPTETIECRGLGLDRHCPIWLLELSASGDLLGGSFFEHHDREPDEVTFDASGSTLQRVRFRVPLPAGPLYDELRLRTVEALACDPVARGSVIPGERDLLRCPQSGIGVVEATADGLATGTLTYVAGPTMVSNRAIARFTNEDGSMEALLYVDLEGTEPLEFPVLPEANALEGGGSRAPDAWARVDAPGFQHAFVAGIRTWRIPGSWRVMQGSLGGQLDLPQLPERLRHDYRSPTLLPMEIWVGAVTSSEGEPWANDYPVASIRRRVSEYVNP